MHEYCSLDIKYIQDIKKNKFKPENNMNLSTSVRQNKKVTNNLSLGTCRLKIEAKEKNCTTLDAKRIIFFFRSFHVSIQMLICIAASKIQLSLQLPLIKYTEHLMML